MGITYRKLSKLTFDVPETPLQVLLDGKVTGLIRATPGGFAYYPKGQGKGRGEIYPTIDGCKASLQATTETDNNAGE